MADLKKEFQFFKDHQEELVNKHNDKYLVIKNQEVQGVYSTELEAYEQAKKKHEPGTFLIQHCLPGDEATTQTFHSRVVFS